MALRNPDRPILFLILQLALAANQTDTVAMARQLQKPAEAPKKLVQVEEDATALNQALFAAVENGLEDKVKELIAQGIDVNVQDEYGLTPLHHAAAAGHINIVEFLLACGARLDIKDNAGRTPLHYAAGASMKIGAYSDDTLEELFTKIVCSLLDNGADINARDNVGWTPLHYATRLRYEIIIAFLLERGADATIMDNRGHTPLSLIRSTISEMRGHPAAPQRLIQYNSIAELLRSYTQVYYVSTEGKDSNVGTIENPLNSIHAAVAVAGPGDSIIVRSGTYALKRSVYLSRSGHAGRHIVLKAYPGDSPVLDFSNAKSFGIVIEGAYWHVKGLIIVNAEHDGLRIEGENAHHNIIEQTVTYANRNIGAAISDKATFNLFLNCDSHHNFDIVFNGDNGDGFCLMRGVNEGNLAIGCRAWNNADDGFDMWEAENSVRLEGCYAWSNGENIWNHPLWRGNSDGFKLGGGKGRHVLIGCLAWKHSLTGTTLNGNERGVILRNCTLWNNDRNYVLEGGGWSEEGRENCVVNNNIAYKGASQVNPKADNRNNSWSADLGLTLTDDDFLSLDDSMMSAPRNPDGSIPQNDFLKLAPTSAAIDKGVDVGMPFVGERPDLGAFEYDPNETSEGYVKMLHQYVRDHDIPKIKESLIQGEGVNEKDWLGYTPLHWAVYFGYPDVVELLLSRGADPDIQSDTGRYALEIAKAMVYADIEASRRKRGAK